MSVKTPLHKVTADPHTLTLPENRASKLQKVNSEWNVYPLPRWTPLRHRGSLTEEGSTMVLLSLSISGCQVGTSFIEPMRHGRTIPLVLMQDRSIAGGNSRIAVLINPQGDIRAGLYSQSTPRGHICYIRKRSRMTQSPCWQGATLPLIAHKWRPL